MATRAQQAHRTKSVVSRRQTREEKRQSRTHASPKKRDTSASNFLHLLIPDREWAPIPFTDADVEPSQLPEALDKAVHAMAEWGVLVEASRASGIGRSRLYKYMRADAVFKARMIDARKNNNERIEREMRARGMLPKGELAAIFVMKHNIPRYREIQRVELTGKNGGPVAYADAKQELLRRLESIALKGQAVDAVVVGEKPRLIRGGSDNAEGVQVKKVDKGAGFKVQSRK